MSESSITAAEPVDLEDVCFGKLCIGAECTNVAAVCGPCWMKVCVDNRELQTKLRVAEAHSAKAFLAWLGLQSTCVEVSGTEGGHPYRRKVSLTDALTDFIAAEKGTK